MFELIKPALPRALYAVVMGVFIIANSGLGQVKYSQDEPLLDSLVRDENHAEKFNGVSPPVDTVPQRSRIAADSAPGQQESEKPVSTDSVAQPLELGKPENAEPALSRISEEPPPLAPVAHPLSPFSSDRMHCWGISLDYFSYAEVSTISDVFPGYPLGYPPNFVQGTPKSTEYGLMFGFNYDGALRQHGSPILFRPHLEAQIGIHQTYSGSTQAQPITNPKTLDTIGFQFLPVDIYKSNYFVHTGVDIGYCITRAAIPFYLYSGIKGNLWYRDMTPDTTSYANQITDAEVYYWFSIPLGLALSRPVSPKLALEFDASLDFMFAGYMKALLSAWDATTTYTTVSPVVTLNNRIGFHAEIPIMYKTDNGHVFRFIPYFTAYAFGQSESEISQSFVNGVYTPGSDQSFDEPNSSSWLLGIKVQIVFLSPYTRTR